MALVDRFIGKDGAQNLREALLEQRTVLGDDGLASRLSDLGEVVGYAPGEILINQDSDENDVFLLLAGHCQVSVNGRNVAIRSAGTHVGEMAALEPSQTRSATVVAIDEVVALKVTAAHFGEVASIFPSLWKTIAKELSRRLKQRNSMVTATHDHIRVFVMSSAEALPIARGIQEGLEHDPFYVTVWTDGVFKASSYPIEALEAAVDVSDFAIAIALPDDTAEIRGETHAIPRDNVIFELGFFMGRLGRQRTILLEPRGEEVKLPSDLKGINTITYKPPIKEDQLPSALGPACNKMRSIFKDLGPHN